jgi:glycosyltransferase involved in cell wall biosynthesis
MKIAIITTSFPAHAGDAAGHFVETEARALAKAGHDVTVIAPGKGSSVQAPSVHWLPDGGSFGWPGALSRLRKSPSRVFGVLRFIVAARKRLDELGPFDRVLSHWIVPGAWPIAVGSSAPLEVVAHGSDVALLLLLPRPIRAWIVGSLLERGAQFRFVSAELRDRLTRATTPVLAAQSRVEPCAIDVSAAPERFAARRRLGVRRHERLVVIASRLIPEKRVHAALGAATLLDGTHVVVVGDGPERAELEQSYPSARFVGQRPRPETLAWIAAADLVIAASRSEGAPTVVREARALGVPVVAAPAGDLPAWAERDRGITVVSAA